MENSIQISTALYASKAAKLACCPGLQIGQLVSGVASTHRPAAARLTEAKVSGVASVIDFMLRSPKQIAAVMIDDVLYLEWDGVSIVMDRENEIRYPEGSRNPSPLLAVAACLIYCLVSGKDKELSKTFETISRQFLAGGVVGNQEMALLCDSFYYGWAKNIAKVTVKDNLLLEEVSTLARSATVHRPEIFKGLGFANPKQVQLLTPAAKKAKADGPDLDKVIDEARKGVYRVAYHWSEDQLPYIQDMGLLDTYIPNMAFVRMLEKIKFRTSRVLARLTQMKKEGAIDRVKAIGKDYINVTFTGKPGTGKTQLAYALGAATGMPVYTVSNSHNTDEDEYQGMTKMVDGKPTSVPTDALRCFEHGGILILEEVNLAAAAVVMGALGQAVEFPFILKKDGYMPIRRHPLCIIISTMNTGTAGSKVMSQPFDNRFKQAFVLDDPTEADFIRILQNTGASRDVCSWVYRCYGRVTACVRDENAAADVESILLALSIRTCIGAIENIQEGMEPREAIRNSLIGKIAEQDMAVASTCARVIDSMPDPDFEEEGGGTV